ncbi:MAG: hypothetical protein K9J37_13585 [Saprospiraceae bacterium]|nr:hypothetical protein [Saprospiraceae bacterium]
MLKFPNRSAAESAGATQKTTTTPSTRPFSASWTAAKGQPTPRCQK